MSTHATATFTIKSWHENPYDEMEGMRKLTRATVTKRFEGQAQTVGMHINLHVAILPNSDISVKSEMH